MVNNDVTKINNVKDVINLATENSLTLNNTNLWAKNKKSNIIYPIQNLFRDSYRPLIIRYCKKLKLNETVQKYYKYHPKTLSYDLYGTTDLWHMILWLNDLTSILQFDLSEVIVLNPSSIEILYTLINNEKDNIYNNINEPINTLE